MTIAARVWESRLGKGRLAGLGLTEDEGYAVQAEANVVLAQTLGAPTGLKIGATAEGMRRLLEVPGPIAGEVFAGTVHEGRSMLRLGDHVRVGIETEIAVRLGRDLTPAEAPWTRVRIAGVVAEVMPAIEIVDDRYADFKSAGAGTIIADNAFNAGSVLGAPVASWRELPLDRLEARTFVDGELVATAVSSELMGHPLEALRWLADRWAGLGRTLPAGRFVSLGSITPVQWISRPSEVRIEIEGLGRVELELV